MERTRTNNDRGLPYTCWMYIRLTKDAYILMQIKCKSCKFKQNRKKPIEIKSISYTFSNYSYE